MANEKDLLQLARARQRNREQEEDLTPENIREWLAVRVNNYSDLEALVPKKSLVMLRSDLGATLALYDGRVHKRLHFHEAWKDARGRIEIISRLVLWGENHIGFDKGEIFLYGFHDVSGYIPPETYKKGDKDYDALLERLEDKGIVALADTYPERHR